ncbi:hypothetical protein AOLI_G00003720 [Acnodon oligacanthus]
MVQGSLGMNVVSAVIAATAFILLLMDFLVFQYNFCYNKLNYYQCEGYNKYLTRTYGISGVLLVFSLLQFIISIFISVFGCRATCCTEPVVNTSPLRMSIAAKPENNPRNGFMVVTQVILPAAAGHNAVGARVQPKALGAVQIMNGVITLVFGTVLTVLEPPFSVYTGVVYWGSLVYIIAGSLTVAAGNRLTPCLVKGSLGMNVSSAVTAGIAVSLLALDFVIIVGENPCNLIYNEVCEVYLQFLERTFGISGVLLVFSVLQFTVSMCLSVFGCKVTCCTEPVVSVVTVAPNYAACCSMVNPFQTHSGQQDVFYITNPNADENNPSKQHPPAY